MPLRPSGANLRHANESADGPLAVFQFYDDSIDVDAYPSLYAAQGNIEGYDVRNGVDDFFAADGRAVEATIGGQRGEDVSLRVTDHDRSNELGA